MSNNIELILILMPVLLVSMSIHEMMHALVSDQLGDPTARLMGRVSFNPLRHIDPFFTFALPILMLLSGGPLIGAAKPVQVNFNRLKYGEFGGAIVGMVGPFTNLLLAVLAANIYNHASPNLSAWMVNVLRIAIELNVGLFIFNSIPWPPLDGSRLLYAFAPRPLQEIMESIERTGWTGLIIFILLFGLYICFGNVLQSLFNYFSYCSQTNNTPGLRIFRFNLIYNSNFIVDA